MNKKGYLLLEVIIAVSLMMMIISGGFAILITSLKDWKNGEAYFDLRYNCLESLNKLTNEIRESYGVEIIDPQKGWIKVYKSIDNTQFITFRAKKQKLFIGFNNTINPNSEFANNVRCFKVEYIPCDVLDYRKAKGVKIYLEFENNGNVFDIDTSMNFRNI